jgi:predicted porin
MKGVGSDTSYFGFRGTEDLGGGLKSYFKLESGFDISNGNDGKTLTFNRESYVGMSSSDLGSVQLGTAWSPAVWLTGRVDPFGRSQLGALQSLFQGTATRGYVVQFPNSMQYISPVASSFQGRLYWGAGNGAPANGRGAAIDYFGSDLYVGVTYDQTNVSGQTVGLPAGTEPTARTLAAGVSYRFPLIKLSAYAQKNRTEALQDINGFALGVSIPVGVGEFRASHGRLGSGPKKAALTAVGYHHYLSKRTSIYASFGSLDNGHDTKFMLWPAVATFSSVAMKAGQDANGVAFGIRHLF